MKSATLFDWSSLSAEKRVQLMTDLVGKSVFISPEPFRKGERKAGPFLGPFIGKTVEVVAIKREIRGDFFMFKAGRGEETLPVLADLTQPLTT